MGSARKRRTEDYDPELGRFLSQDDLEPKLDEPPSLNLYLYANANPTRYVDPDGHESMAELAARERERRQALGQTAPSYTNDQGGQVVRADGPVVVPDRGPRGTTLDEPPPGQRQWLDQEIARLRQERAQQGSNAAVTVQEERSLLDKYREKREQLKQWVQGKAEQGADSLTHPADDPIAEARKEELRRATEGTSSEQAGRALADRNIAKGVNETAVEGSGIAAREGTELGIQYVETEVGLRAAGVGLGMVSGGLRKVPNPFGKLGSPAHRMRVAEVKAEIEARGLIADTEVRIQTVGGVKDARYMDVVARDPVTNKVVEVHQVGRVLKSDPLVPVARERAALRDVRRSPELRDAKRVFHEY